MSPTLLIVDDHPEFRSFVRAMLAADGFDVTGDVPDGEAAVAAVRELEPDVVLLDVQLPGIDGFEVANRIAALEAPPAVILTSTRDAEDFEGRLSAAPVLGFVPKHSMSVDRLLELLDGVQPASGM
jgi:DNA-binding NarL/FixJ family response regulator